MGSPIAVPVRVKGIPAVEDAGQVVRDVIFIGSAGIFLLKETPGFLCPEGLATAAEF